MPSGLDYAAPRPWLSSTPPHSQSGCTDLLQPTGCSRGPAWLRPASRTPREGQYRAGSPSAVLRPPTQPRNPCSRQLPSWCWAPLTDKGPFASRGGCLPQTEKSSHNHSLSAVSLPLDPAPSQCCFLQPPLWPLSVPWPWPALKDAMAEIGSLPTSPLFSSLNPPTALSHGTQGQHQLLPSLSATQPPSPGWG